MSLPSAMPQAGKAAECLEGMTLPSAPDAGSLWPALERIATTTARHLRQGGYLSEQESSVLLAAYPKTLQTASTCGHDFLLFTAEVQVAKKPSLTVEGEVARMQKVLRGSLNERVHAWSFGPLPGRPSSLYDHCPGLRAVCSALACPAVLAGETSIVHIVSLNPIAALVSAFWIGHELNRLAEGESPFVFCFVAELPAWQLLVQRHFAP